MEKIQPFNDRDELFRRIRRSRRMFALMHNASLPDGVNPASFINIALLDSIPQNINEIRKPAEPKDDNESSRTAAIFYSVSSHPGLTGIKVGSHLIFRSVERLQRSHPSKFILGNLI